MDSKYDTMVSNSTKFKQELKKRINSNASNASNSCKFKD
jgi:hypothetical protein